MADIGSIVFGTSTGSHYDGHPGYTFRAPGVTVERPPVRAACCAFHGTRTEIESEQRRVRVRQGWETAGRCAVLLTTVMLGQEWAVVRWEDEDDPDCFKLAGLELL